MTYLTSQLIKGKDDAASSLDSDLIAHDLGPLIERRFLQNQQTVHKRVDRLFAVLLFLEWVAGILAAIFISPKAWSGTTSQPHLHVYTAIFLGATIIALPIALSFASPGRASTRHVIAIGQMLMVSLLIHLSGGRIENHFHIFVSLAFLAFYCDWKVLITASLVVALDHLIRGIYYPRSLYGTFTVENWRWAEHTSWVVFQDIFLVWACLANTKDMRMQAAKSIAVENSQELTEAEVKSRTLELRNSEKRIATQYTISDCLNRSVSISEASPVVLSSICEELAPGILYAAIWLIEKEENGPSFVDSWSNDSENEPTNFRTNHAELGRIGKEMTERICLEKHAVSANKQLGGTALFTREETILSYAAPIKSEAAVLGSIVLFMPSSMPVGDELAAVLDAIGQQLGHFIVLKRAKQENERLVHILQYAADAIIGLEYDGSITSWNEGAQRMFGWTSAEIIDKPYTLLLPPNSEDELKNLLQSVRQKGRLENIEKLHRHKDGSNFYVAQSWSATFDPNGGMSSISVTGRDTTEKKEAEKRVAEFYSTVSHELRTPLTSIRGSLGLLEGGKAGELTEKGERLVHIARGESDRLIRLINDILDIRKIEEGKFELRLSNCLVRDIIMSTIDGVRGMADLNRMQIIYGNDLSDYILCDRDKITQVLTNLLSNAIKFSPTGGSIVVDSKRTNSSKLRFSVKDEGGGISPDQQNKLFCKFQQLDSSDTRQKGGTGLGLAISKAIVEEHGGEIGVDSAVGKGSTFWFELPLADERSAVTSQMLDI